MGNRRKNNVGDVCADINIDHPGLLTQAYPVDNIKLDVAAVTVNTSRRHSYVGPGHSSPAMSSTSLPDWPPSLTEEQHAHLLLLSTTYALSHGFTLLPPAPTSPPTHAFAAPLSLFPTPFPRRLYDLAKEIQPLYNALYARIALDWEFLDRVMGGSVSKVDSFQGELWRGWRGVREELVQVGHLSEERKTIVRC